MGLGFAVEPDPLGVGELADLRALERLAEVSPSVDESFPVGLELAGGGDEDGKEHFIVAAASPVGAEVDPHDSALGIEGDDLGLVLPGRGERSPLAGHPTAGPLIVVAHGVVPALGGVEDPLVGVLNPHAGFVPPLGDREGEEGIEHPFLYTGFVSYRDTFIAVSEDCPGHGEAPPHKEGKLTAAEIQYELLARHPYRYTHDEALFESSTLMREHPAASGPEKEALRARFFSKSQACLRASALPKRYGWGLHFDAEGKGAAYAVGSEEYRRLAADASLTQTRGMRSKRA